jgi:hypothetical protein
VIGGTASGSAKLNMPARKLPVCRSGTLATRSDASAKAAEKPPTLVAMSRTTPCDARTSSSGPRSLLRRDTLLWRAVA